MVKRLIVDHLWFKEETDKGGSDDIHIFSFQGNTITTFNSNIGVHVPGNFWDGLLL